MLSAARLAVSAGASALRRLRPFEGDGAPAGQRPAPQVAPADGPAVGGADQPAQVGLVAQELRRRRVGVEHIRRRAGGRGGRRRGPGGDGHRACEQRDEDGEHNCEAGNVRVGDHGGSCGWGRRPGGVRLLGRGV
jgi:hypothetical protein